MSAPRAKVGALAEQVRGVSYGKEDASDSRLPGYLPVLRAGNITDDGLTYDDLVFVPKERISDKQKIRQHDVVVAASSGSLDVVGKAAPALTDFDGSFGAFCKVLRPNAKVHPGYFAHFFKTLDYRRRVSALAAGANINNLRNEHLDEMEIPLPPLAEQRRIAEVLDQAEALRTKRRAALAQLHSLTQSLFLDLFGDPVANPKQWPNPTLGGLLTFQQYGPRFFNESYSADGIRIVRITDLDEAGNLDFSAMPRMTVSEEDREKYSLRPGDIIFARTGATVGKVALMQPNDPPCIAGAYFITMRFEKTLDPLYARAVLTAPSVRAIVTKRSRQAAQQNFSGPGLRQLPMPLPPVPLQREFSRRVTAVEKLNTAQRASLTELNALFATLQHRAFKGEL